MTLINHKIQLLKILAGHAKALEPEPKDQNWKPLTDWLIGANLGAAAYELVGKSHPAIKPNLQNGYYASVYRDTIQKKLFLEIAQPLAEKNVEMILLKGIALAPLAWDKPYLRYRADIDFLVGRPDLSAVSQVLKAAGFSYKKPEAVGRFFDDLPETNKEGQLEMVSPTADEVQIEAHTEVFLGHVQRITSGRIEADLWDRRVPTSLEPGQDGALQFWRLSNEDMLLHLMIHTGVNHQFDANTLRNMLDVIRTADRLPIDWTVLFERVVHMRMTTAVWLFLELTADIWGELSSVQARHSIRPNGVRRWILKQLINRESVLKLTITTHTWKHPVLLALLVDRPVDLLKIAIRFRQLTR